MDRGVHGVIGLTMAEPLAALNLINSELPTAVRSFTVLFGGEAFLRQTALQMLLGPTTGNDSELQVTRFVGDNVQFLDVRDEVSTGSLFGDRRAVVVDAADRFVSQNRSALEGLAEKPPRDNVLVLIVDSFPANTRLYKSLANSGLLVNCGTPAEKDLRKWLVSWAQKKHGAKLTADGADLLVQIVGNNPGLLDQELAKLSASVKQGEKITPPLVEQLVGSWRTRTSWEMIDAATSGNTADALLQLDRLLSSGDPPIAVLGALAFTLRRFAGAARIVQRAREQRQSITLSEALKQAGLRTYPAALKKAEDQLRQIGSQRASQLLKWILEADLALKGTASSPARGRIVLEQLLVRLGKQMQTPAASPAR